jgi:hypothetical protein
VLPILLVAVVALVAMWGTGIFVHGRQGCPARPEGTAQELSGGAQEAMDDDALATNVIRFFIVVVAS